jgi:hypothetical protein
VSYMTGMSSAFRVYSSMFCVQRSCFMCISSKCCRNISALTLELGDPWKYHVLVGRSYVEM